MAPVTRVGKSSQSIPAVRVNRDAILPEWTPVPLTPEPMHVTGARRWFDSGRPDGTAIDYPTWVK